MAAVNDLILKLERFELELRAEMPSIMKEVGETMLSFTLTEIRRNGGIRSNAQYSNNPGVPAYLYRGKNKDYPKALNAAGRAYIESKIKYSKRIAGFKAKDLASQGIDRFPRGSANPFNYAGFINWKGLRAAQGLQITKVDLTYSGRMLQSVTFTGNTTSGDVFRVIFGGSDMETRDKLKWNFERYGDFLAFSDECQRLGTLTADKRISEIYRRVVLN